MILIEAVKEISMDELHVEQSAVFAIEKRKGSMCLLKAYSRLFYIDLALVLFSFIALMVLGMTTHALLFDMSRNRLTLISGIIFAVFLVIQFLFRRHLTSSRIFDWIPLLSLFAVYESLKHVHANRITEWLRISPKDAVMAQIDKLLFGAVLPLKLERLSSELFISIMWFFYFWVYYCGPALLLAWIYFRLRDRNLFEKLRHLLVIGFLGGYVIYILVPVAGPLFHIGDQFTIPIITHPVIQTLAFGFRYNWDCFPSLHTAIPWLLTIAVWRKINIAARLICLISSIGVTASTVFLRLHYGIDLIAGLIWAILVYVFAAVDLPGFHLTHIFSRLSKVVSRQALRFSLAFRTYLLKSLSGNSRVMRHIFGGVNLYHGNQHSKRN